MDFSLSEEQREMVDTVRKLQKYGEIAGAQAEPVLGPTEIEASVRRKLAFGVFASVPSSL